MAIFQIKDGFCINTSGVDGQEIDTISTEITSAASDNVLVTQKAIKDYVDEHGSGGSIPITTKGDMVIGDENGDAIRMPIGTSGQTLMVTSGGDLAYCDILTRSSVTWGSTIGTYTTSATSNNFLDIRGNYGYNSGSQEYIKNSGVRLTLNQDLLTVNTDGLDLGAPYRVDNLGCAIRSRRYNSYGTRYQTVLLGDVGYNQTSSYSTVGASLGIRVGNGTISIAPYGNSNRATSAIASYDISNYSSVMSNVVVMFKTSPCSVPEWSGNSYNSQKSYFTVGKVQQSGDGVVTICSSATNQYGDTRAKCDTVALRVRSGWSIFNDQIFSSSTTYVRGTLYPRKVIVGRPWPLSSQQYSDGGIVYGYGETSARDAITSYGKDPGRQYYTTDDNRVNVYNNTTSGWDKIAYLSDVGGGGGGMVAEIGDMFSRETYGVYSDAVSFLYRFNPKSNTLHGGYFIPTQDNVNLPENISFSAVVFEGEGSWYDTVTKVAETSSFDTTNLGTDKKFRFTFEDTQLDDDKNYWLMFSVQYLSGQGNGSCLTSFAVNSNDMSNLAVAYSTDIITEKEDFDMYSQEPSSYMPYVVLV